MDTFDGNRQSDNTRSTAPSELSVLGKTFNVISEQFDVERSAEPRKESPQSYLHHGIDSITSKIIKDDGTRETVDQFATEFVKTAAMFAVRKIGLGGVAVAYGLDQAKPSDSVGNQIVDFGLGAAKGTVIRSVYQFGGAASRFPPTIGIAMGLTSRAADETFKRESFSNPSDAAARVVRSTFDPRMMALDAVVWTGAEATFGALNTASKGALARSPLASGISMGATFGALNDSGRELMRQQQADEKLDYLKVLQKGAYGAVLSGAGAGAGLGSSLKYYNWRSQNSDSGRLVRELEPLGTENDKSTPRQFTIVSGKDSLEAFREKRSQSALITVTETLPKGAESGRSTLVRKGLYQSATFKPGTVDGTPLNVTEKVGQPIEFRPYEKTIYFQRLGANESKLGDNATLADLLVTCYPENLTSSLREKHAFPDGNGKVWMMTDRKNNLLLTNDMAPQTLRQWRRDGFDEPTRLDAGQTKLDVMAPLLVGDPKNLNSETSKAAWDVFDKQLADAKKLGVDSVSTDVWWGLIEPKKGEFDFSYIDKLAERIEAAGLKWIPILSFHKAGGNIGDDVTVPIPEWVWDHLGKQIPNGTRDSAKYKSEQGNLSDEYISVWSDKHAVPLYRSAMSAFQEHYAGKKDLISEINVSLGPAGEMRYPSYNSHDKDAGYPTRGALQAYSDSAIVSFRDSILTKYGGIDGVRKAWNLENLKSEEILPPGDPKTFFESNHHHHLQYGRDFFDWYNQSLIDHGNVVMTEAQSVFSQKGASFAGVDLGAKVAGVHWRVGRWDKDSIVNGDRLAELSAGLIRTSGLDWHSDALGRGYRPLLEMFKDVQKKNDSDTLICPSFTCLELPDGDNGAAKMAMPFSLAKWFGHEGERQGLWLRGENALSQSLVHKDAWDRIRTHLFMPGEIGSYHGVTLLRINDVVENADARAKMAEIIAATKSVAPSAWQHFFRMKTMPPLNLVKPAA